MEPQSSQQNSTRQLRASGIGRSHFRIGNSCASFDSSTAPRLPGCFVQFKNPQSVSSSWYLAGNVVPAVNQKAAKTTCTILASAVEAHCTVD